MLKPALYLIQFITFLILSLTGPAVLSADESRYGPVSNNENLWDIANQFTADGNLITSQVAVSIFRRNPQAFSENNINGLIKDHILIIPATTEMQSIPKQIAEKVFMQHWKNWKNGLTQAAPLENAQVSPRIESSPVTDLKSNTPDLSSPGKHPPAEITETLADAIFEAESVVPAAENNRMPVQAEQTPPTSLPAMNRAAVESVAKASVSLPVNSDPGFQSKNELLAGEKEKNAPALQESPAWQAEKHEPVLTETQILHVDKNNPVLSENSNLQTELNDPPLQPENMTAKNLWPAKEALSPEIRNNEAIAKQQISIDKTSENKPARSLVEDIAEGDVMSQLQAQVKNNLPYIAGFAGLGLLLLLFLSKEQTYPMVKLTTEPEKPDTLVMNEADKKTARKILLEVDSDTQKINFAASVNVTEKAGLYQNDFPEKNNFNNLSEHEIKSSAAEKLPSFPESDDSVSQTDKNADSDELSAISDKFKQDYPLLQVMDEEDIFAELKDKSGAAISENAKSTKEYTELEAINEEELLALLNDESEAAVSEQKKK